MRTWQIQTARSRFSELVDAALGDGPQRVTRRGREAVILVSEQEWLRTQAAADADFGRLLTSFPEGAAEFLPERRPARALREPPAE